jgi:hypothetical protein
MEPKVSTGDPLYVPSSDVSIAMSLGASFVEGDSRLRVPSPLPDGVQTSDFARWVTPQARVTWLSEMVEMVSENEADLLDLAEIVSGFGVSGVQAGDVVRLYVPRSEMDRARVIPGVSWSRELGMYVADRTASFELIFPYMTESVKSVWAMDRNIASEIDYLVKARALIAEKEEEDQEVPQREIETGDMTAEEDCE